MKKKTLHIFFLIGASGVGKSTLVANLKKKYKDKNWAFLLFSDIGLPSKKEKIKKYGSAKAWQKATTEIWINKILTEYLDKDVVVFEGQTNLDFICKGFASHKFSNYSIVLVDCSKQNMFDRLINNRKQPELATPEMNYWREELLNQAINKKIPIINTDNLNEQQTVEVFDNILKKQNINLR
jgi:adenylate kinase family enzyme